MTAETPLTPAQLAAREEAAVRSLLEMPAADLQGGLTLRPITLASLAMLRQTKNEFLAPLGPEVDVPDPRTGGTLKQRVPDNEFFAALAFAYLHAADEGEVRRSIWTESFFREQVLAWGDRLAVEDLRRLIPEIQRRLERIRQLDFTTQPKPDEGGGPTPPPN